MKLFLTLITAAAVLGTSFGASAATPISSLSFSQDTSVQTQAKSKKGKKKSGKKKADAGKK